MKKFLAGLVISILLLLAISVVMIYSTSGIFAQETFGDENFYLKKQLSWIGISFLSLLIFSYFPYRFLRTFSFLLVFVAIGLLILTMCTSLSHTAGGATRWLKLGGIRFQPSELAKLAIIIYLADVLSRKQDTVKNFAKSLLFPSMLIGLILILILQQPDLGTTALLACVTLLIFHIGGMRMGYFFLFITTGIVSLYFLVILFPYRMERIMTFIDPFKDPRGSGFQIIQSFIALGSGGLTGVGLGKGMQKLYYLPEAHTDFIFAIIGEELGLIGTGLIVILFFILFVSGLVIAYRCRDPFGKLLAVAITLTICIQALINIAVVTGSIPTKGIPLPFLSFGGSNLLINLTCIGILLNIGVNVNNNPIKNVIKKKERQTKVGKQKLVRQS